MILFGFIWDLLVSVRSPIAIGVRLAGRLYSSRGHLEGVFVFLLIRFVGLPLIPKGSVDFGHFWLEYGVIWLFTYLLVQIR